MKNLNEYLLESSIDPNWKEKVRTYKYGAYRLNKDLNDYIEKNFKYVNKSKSKIDGKWYTVYYGDSKYGRYMINLDNECWRDVDFDEFYGGSVVD
jgi:hypothetical protein